MSRLGLASIAIIAAIVLAATVGPLVWTIDPIATDPAHGLAGTSGAHPFGTDELGRDVLSRLLYGAQLTLAVGLAAMLAALVLGTMVGATAGFYGGWVDGVLMRFTDAMLAVPAFFLTLTKKHPRHSIESYMEHFEYCAQLVGIEHVAFGPDTLFGDHVGLHHYFARQLSIKAAHGQQDFTEVEFVDGIENPGEAFPNIVRWLVKHSYSDGDIAKAIGGNLMRVLDEVWWH